MTVPNYELAARRAARKHGIDADIFVRQLKQESGLRPGQTSPANAQGIAQFIPPTAKAYGVDLHDGRVSDDLDGAARYMRDNLRRTGGSYAKALSIYNSGRPDAYKDPSFAKGETYNYVKKILGGQDPKASGSVVSSSGGKAAPSRSRTVTTSSVDEAGMRDARGEAALGRLLASRRPQGLLTRLGALRTTDPTPEEFTRTATRTETAPTADRASSPASRPRKGQSPLLELFWQGPGGINVKNGKKVQQGFVSGHTTHVHVAAGPKTVDALGRLAQKMGLRVGENETFDRVDPVHTDGSYHYRDQAIDVSGDPKKMAAFARTVARRHGVK